MGCGLLEPNFAGTKHSYRIRVFSGLGTRAHGGRSGVREACEPAHRVLDDLVQGHPVLLLQRGVPAQVRLQAGALSRACARTAPKPSRVVTVVRDLRVPHEVRSFQSWLAKDPKPREPRYSKLRRASAGGIRCARIAGL